MTGTNAARTVYAEFKLVDEAGDEDVKRIIDALNAVALLEDAIEAWELADEKATLMTDRIPSVGGEGHNTWQTHHASSNRVRDKDDCAVGAGENCRWPECADEKGGCLMPIPEPGMHAIPNSAAEPELRAGAVGDREVAQARPTARVERVARALAKRNRAEDWDYFIPQAEAVLEAADADATPNRVLHWRCVRCLAEWTMEMPGYPGSMIGGSHHHYRDGKRCDGPITAALDA